MKVISWLRKIIGFQNLSTQIQENSKILNELNWANIFNNTICNSYWLTDRSFSPGRFAIGYPLLYVLFRVLDEVKPIKVLEFGLGQSTKMLYQYATHFKETEVTTLENDVDWINFFLREKNFPSNSIIMKVDNQKIIYNECETLSISNLNLVTQNNKYALILVDAPFGSKRYSRSQILSLIPNNIDIDNFIIIMDDYNREGEKETSLELEKVFIKNNIKYRKGVYAGIKETALYCSNDLKFLTTL